MKKTKWHILHAKREAVKSENRILVTSQGTRVAERRVNASNSAEAVVMRNELGDSSCFMFSASYIYRWDALLKDRGKAHNW